MATPDRAINSSSFLSTDRICGAFPFAKSQRYELCGDKCRKTQALQNKREFDKRERKNHYDLLYKNKCQNWRSKINKTKKTTGFPSDRLEEMLTGFEAFKKEALQRKKAGKGRTASPKEFMDWLYQQNNNYCKADGILTKDKMFTQSKRRLAKQDVFRNSFYTWQMSYY